ncbi:MAG: indole-3-glycerol phosphate synthase TrpC [Zymomonas mobilis subsp. pomaceae]|uniref:Indole-3-glycerol phosphate synthase n=1 Tax=Zymomonas mobilis subsp. pomaceae (strain ATCC 29192 / DSM 22645 / JCM 10191 / CCUG 17912 / NBRC 13757 / NCIMB 11200 / NRRL B-4491 / Barker I) TaxID=579138 RepID=TRPC_ZYMMT|nr:indole-3-glycerol phosphate synthase TrpC [Zymomonas mobilis]Q9XBM3.2 RecName: Full=Indole-3-glycerol phosphate synthase; Short=IGPS [Zymomonas mobilis subsp. pomaceae ATCC 29192]AEI37573.1 Indole-3-glycerol-phosphate synthase [Zymomonas mobilis subsp. pomaceae ATCC 29192]MDX5948941.1 indole-3-glycerol phosphate synthase TrpC [Zymomonas mobilis subsp. pomaceae]GEB88746.1 indole-3-glycerol phosphate synthase [Zymomonas mobilis subsp. pomaceae]
MSNILTEICATKARHVADKKKHISETDLYNLTKNQTAPRGFRAALDKKRAEGKFSLIAEIKKASPSKGLIRPDFEPILHARSYQEGGAACLSVLTDQPYFQGHEDYLIAARNEVTLPVLRKDFMIDPWQVTEARAIGADAILIIVAALEDNQMQEIEAAALEYGMDALIEVHSTQEMERALRLKSRLIGVNNRDLRDFSVSFDRTYELIKQAPKECTFVAESGIQTHDDLVAMNQHNIGCFLVGETLMRQKDVKQATRDLLGLN